MFHHVQLQRTKKNNNNNKSALGSAHYSRKAEMPERLQHPEAPPSHTAASAGVQLELLRLFAFSLISNT